MLVNGQKGFKKLLKQLTITTPLEDIANLQSLFLNSKTIEDRKAIGQFFTSSILSEYMASLINKPESKTIRLLDAGAGIGILTASAALHCLNLGCKTFHAVLYELDEEAIPGLEQTIKTIQNIFREQHASFTFEVRQIDFVLSRPDKDNNTPPFNICVLNPPYFKYSVQKSHYTKATSDLYHGDPNIYASFTAIAMSCMQQGGQLITITPRSFTNGLYFRGFRSYMLSESALDLIHIFRKRDKIFKNKDSAVLQENVICRFIKGMKQSDIIVRSSNCDSNISNADEESYALPLIIDTSNDQKIIRIPESAHQAAILRQAERLSATFENAGYFISTGRVVEHRTRSYITDDINTDNTVPLYRPHNVSPLQARWTGEHRKDVVFELNDGHEKHTIENNNFVLLKRFSSKDEKRRLVSGVYLKNTHDCELVGFGNKTNYIGLADGNLTKVEAYGLAAIFNSSFMDKYFRCISGNTQVNATEIRVMKFPSREQVKRIGRLAQNLKWIETSEIDLIVNPILGVMDTI